MNYGKVILGREDFVASEKKDEITYAIRAIVHEIEDERVDCIEAMIQHEPTEDDFAELHMSHLADAKRGALHRIVEYDVSESVNGFKLNGEVVWLDKDTRVGLVNLLASQKESSQETTTLWLGGHPIVLGISTALDMLRQLEVYAGQCYNQTEAHKAAVEALETFADVEAYDITAGYPEQLSFTIPNE